MNDLTDDDRDEISQALVLWRYVGHGFRDTANCLPSWRAERRRERAIELATKLGLRKRYVTRLLQTPVMTIKVLE